MSIFLVACTKAPAYKIKHVVDGDTLVLTEFPDVRYDLAYIDAPEREQPYGREARAYLKQLFADQQVDIVFNVNQELELFVDGQSINYLMVKQGYAWAQLNIADSIDSLSYTEAQKQAANNGTGLWSLEHGLMIAPWQWREQSTERAPSMNSHDRLKRQRELERKKALEQQYARMERQREQRARYEQSKKLNQQVSEKELTK
ncbi:thermonuclease family protein [Paraglaciecola aquimarina]|uniref:Thermonuclease family protein n=1 Tax=Paraglaciecola algarum TaxID=3050085 RepID=A0ABS9D6F8_9ALTE|nr:thermonuclease family protein [Paraglaciecola sp. G1-23]